MRIFVRALHHSKTTTTGEECLITVDLKGREDTIKKAQSSKLELTLVREMDPLTSLPAQGLAVYG